MTISGYSDVTVPAYHFTDTQKKSSASAEKFSQLVQSTNTLATKPASTSAVSADEEMEAFKKEIYNEISQLYGKGASAVLSNSVNITEDGFERMKNDPEYKKEIMHWLRQDAAAASKLPYGVHSTTTITANGGQSYGANVYPHDSISTKASKKAEADKKAEDAFYHYNQNKERDEGIDFDKIWLQDKEKRELLEKIQMGKSQSKRDI